MPTLNWIGKEQVVNHDKLVSFRLLKKVKSLSVGESSQNLIIHGDNLEALKSLMPYYYGKIKCIYIDPPYNTGNENWVYNDKVNSPKIKKWLGKVVGGESEDLCRHDKWLCMMYPRLKLLKDLLSDSGVIFISIDDYEFDHLKLILDEIFGRENHINTLIWRKNAGASNDVKYFGIEHEYILCYSKKIGKVDRFFTGLLDKHRLEYKHKDSNFNKFGAYKRYNLYQPGIDENRPNLQYEIDAPDGSKISIKPHIWRYSKETFLQAKKEGKIDFVKNKKSGEWQVFTKIYLHESGEERRIKPRSIFSEQGFTLDGNRELKEIFGEKVFNYPKPSSLIRYLIAIITHDHKESIILDSFAGTGTTGHAVLQLNKKDKGDRRFILIEMEDHVAKKVTVERIKRAIEKEDHNGGFEFCELDKPLFNEEGKIDEECTFEQLANYIYFTETQTNLDKKQIKNSLIGSLNETDYYLIFKERGKNILNKSFLKSIKKDDNNRVIYADKCLLDEENLEKHKIQFKQIPYEVRIY
ncbi:MAG: site-specific DNA-methyltransferase [Nanoarchaeota archaeon]